MNKKLLLHLCCAPCSIYVWQKLEEDFDVSGYFYNPNIQPQKEYLFRVREVKKMAKERSWKLVIGPYDVEKWFEAARELRREPERGKRCSFCFGFRLAQTFQQAQEKDCDIVASTLSISPYKVTQQINQEGLRLSKEFGVEFLPENFKKQGGYEAAKALAQKCGIMHQNYCGCVYSKAEKILKSREKPNPNS